MAVFRSTAIIRRVPADLVSVAEIRYGPFTRTDLRLPVLPRKYLLADGFLGLDAINGTRVTLDFHRKQLRIDQPKSKFLPPEPGTEIVIVKAAGNSGRLRATDCYIDGVKAAAFIDTGAEISLGNPALEAALHKRNAALTELGPATLTGVTGGELIGHIIPIEKVTLKDLMFTQGDLVIANVPDFDDWDLTTKPALLLGMDYLRQFASVSIDYRTHEIRFDLSSLQGRPSRPAADPTANLTGTLPHSLATRRVCGYRWTAEPGESDLGAAVKTAGIASLSRRQKEILRLIARHLQAKEIARLLSISEGTVRTHTEEARRRLGVATTRDAALLLASFEREQGEDALRNDDGPQSRGMAANAAGMSSAGYEQDETRHTRPAGPLGRSGRPRGGCWRRRTRCIRSTRRCWPCRPCAGRDRRKRRSLR